MKFLSVCSGIEAASVAWHDLGFECVGVSEIDKFPSEVLKHHYPSVPNLGDMTKYKEWKDDLAPDLLVGGTPCQSFSVAGLRKGMDDPRGNLALTYVGIAEKYKPQWFIWENVPGVLSSSGGKDFSSFLSAMADIGYGIAYRVLDAQFFGVPQRRRRVFVVGYFGDWRPAVSVLFEPSSVFGHTPKGRKKGKGTTAPTETSPRTDDGKRIGNFDLYDFPKEGISPTLNALRAKDCIVYSGSLNADKVGALLARDYKDINTDGLLQGKAIIEAQLNADKSGTLLARDYKGIGFDEAYNDKTIVEAQFWNGSQTAEALTATSNNQRMADKGRMQMVVEPNSLAFRKSRRAQTNTDDETWVDDGLSNTLNNFDLGDIRTTHAVVTQESTVFNVKTEVKVRKHHLDVPSFQKLLKEAKGKSNLTNQEIANILGIPKTQVEHYFRTDDSFAIVDSELWIPLKNALGINDNSFDSAITEFEIKDNAFESAGRIYLSNLAPTLTQAAAGKQSFIVNESCVYENHGTDSRVKPIDLSSTVTARWGTGGGNVPFVREIQPIVLMDQGGSFMSINDSGLVGTLRAQVAGHPPIVTENTHATLTTTHGPRQGSSDEGVSSIKAIFSNTMRVRRLTPVECERLQGFPDGWTQIPYGKKNKEQCPEGHRYKALGNSMAVPVMKWIGRRIKLFNEVNNAIQNQKVGKTSD